ncbi:tetratricopeptide repeat protein [Porifericola rhodea]|uniref:tetratricopeptide repeat-containing sensor histidine kinase n=1 Tax=Porifericola rhodea TaxID=930972 RepID=UPI002666B56D|nr:ATP-binding protein [Porifericola rhodea]WKN33514.1 tetratricopeptide repeat protein [Porifericola rhodea]
MSSLFKSFVISIILLITSYKFPCSAQVLNENIADSLIHIYLHEDLKDSAKCNLALEIAEHATHPKVTLKYSKIALHIAENLNKLSWQAAASLNIGQAYKKLGDNQKAVEAVIKSAKLYRQDSMQIGVASAYIALGTIYSQLSSNSLSQQYYEKAIKIFREESDSVRLATAVLNIGGEYRINKEYKTAFECYEEAKELFQSLQYEVGIAYALGNIGLVKAEQKKFNVAHQYLDSAIAMLQTMGDDYAIADYQLSLARIYREKEEPNKALDYALLSKESATKGMYMEELRDAHKLLSELYTEQKNYLKAFEHQSAYITYRDSLTNEEVIRNMADMRTEFEVEQKQAEIDLINASRKIERLIQTGLLVLLVFVILLTLLLYRNFYLQKKNNQQLEYQKQVLADKNEELDALVATRDKFYSIISHDLRSPIHAFRGIYGLLKSYVEKGQYEHLLKLVSHMEKDSQQLGDLLDNLLSWTVMQQGDIPNHPEYVRVKPIAEEVLNIFQIMAISKQIELVNLVNDDVELWVDRNAFFTILRNLVNNALKFTPSGQVKINASLKGAQVAVQVQDTGIGMTDEQVASLFRSQNTNRSWGTSGEKGVGLGLQLVYEFVDRNMGSIKVKSQKGQGTTFTILFPASKDKSIER